MPWPKVDRREFLFYSMLPALQGLNPNRDGSKPPENPVIYAPARSQFGITAGLPAGIAAAIANPAVTSYKVPRGRYTMLADVTINRPNFELNFNGSSVIYTAPSNKTFWIRSTIVPYVDEGSPTRNASKLTGTVTSGTTSLTMAEVVDVVPGEQVMLMLGVDPLDPVEPEYWRIRTVLSVVGDVVTFSEAMGVAVTTYANEAAFTAVVASGQEGKINDWGEDYNSGQNWSKGFLGTEHGMLRYVGGVINSNITIKNVHVEMAIPASAASYQVDDKVFQLVDVKDVNFKNVSAMNVTGELIHQSHCRNVDVNVLNVRGEGRSLLFAPDSTFPGQIFGSWGGENITCRSANIKGTNLNLSVNEQRPRVTYTDLVYDVKFDGTRWSHSNPSGLITTYDTDTFVNASIKLSGNNSRYDYTNSGAPVVFAGHLVINQSSFADYFAFRDMDVQDYITVNSIVYGPRTTLTQTIALATNKSLLTWPKGFLVSMRLRFLVAGSLNDFYDIYTNYNSVIGTGAWISVYTDWTQVPPTDAALASYFTSQRFSLGFSGGVAASVEIEYDYLPAPPPANTSWVTS